MAKTSSAAPPAGEDERREGRPHGSSWRALVYAQRVTVFGAMVCALILELSGLIGEGGVWWQSTFISGLSYIADSIVIWLVIMVLVGLTNRVTLSVGIVVALSVVIAVTNRVKLGLRAEPVYPSDIDFLRQPAFLAEMVAPAFLVLAVIALLAIVVIAWLLGRRFEPPLARIWPAHLPLRRQLAAVLTRAALITLVIVLLADTTRFNAPGNAWRGLYEAGGDRWRYWNQRTNYLANGFVGGFLYNMPTTAMATPQGYGPEAMDALAARWTRAAAQENRGRTGSLDDTNVVFVLSESFSDPTLLKGFELERDPIPLTRARMARITSGTMMPQLYGGGTANMEFEALTGQSMGLFEPQLSSPYQMLLPGFEDYPSAVGWFASHGHTPIAVHPYLTSFYKRNEVYQTLGFTDFIHDTTMERPTRIDDNPYISDDAAFDEVRDRITASDSPLMVNLVTMQNHIPVDGNYADPIPVSGVDGTQADRLGNYARGIEYTDRALNRFLNGLKRSGEKTIVVFYGDHLPGIYDGAITDANPDLGLYRTPFLIWSSEGQRVERRAAYTSPIHFLPMLYDVADAPIPPYFLLLDRWYRYVSAMELGRWYTPDGRKISEADLDPQGRRVLQDLRMVQYDFSIGQRYALERIWPGSLGPAPTEVGSTPDADPDAPVGPPSAVPDPAE
ncbi:LTA synthase family protein [Nocardioides sp.]|uniref:LTA synthase family protein n=1 Tax=Nocardioides sp. TaxID=35761 RepID=UPI003512A10C